LIPYFELPTLHLGPFNIQAFGVFAAAGVYLAVRLTARAAERQGKDPKPVLDYALWGVLTGVIVGHAAHIFLYHPEELRDPKRIFQFWEGLSSFGGLLGGILAAAVFFRRRGLRFHDYSDAFALGMAPGWAVARLGCFAVHDHPGVTTHFPLAVTGWPFPGGPRHDLGLYDAVVLFAIGGLLALLDRRQILRGRLMALLAVLYGVARFLLDFLRASDVPYADARYLGLTPAQYACFLLLAYAAWRFRRDRPAEPAHPPRRER
jgi:phosphatidylglycerol:prolipoprotein diacylglycerol transferase